MLENQQNPWCTINCNISASFQGNNMFPASPIAVYHPGSRSITKLVDTLDHARDQVQVQICYRSNIWFSIKKLRDQSAFGHAQCMEPTGSGKFPYCPLRIFELSLSSYNLFFSILFNLVLNVLVGYTSLYIPSGSALLQLIWWQFISFLNVWPFLWFHFSR